MKSKLYQITPYNINDNNFYNFISQLKFNQFLDKIEKPVEKDVSIVKLEAYNKIMYKLKFENESEEKTFCGFKYMIVDNKYWFITNFEIKKNNNAGFITYYAQLDHWATQWLTVKKHIHNKLKNKSVYIERMHQTRWYYYSNQKSLGINLDKDSFFHIEEKLKINDYIPKTSFELKSENFKISSIENINLFNKCYYFLRWQLKKPIIVNDFKNTTHKDFGINYIFIFLDDKNMEYYLTNFNPKFMTIFSVIDIKKYKFRKINKIKDELAGSLYPNDDDKYISDLDFYKLNFSSDLYESIDIRDIPLNFVKKDFNYLKNIENELIFNMFPYSKYLFIKGNNVKEYKINNLLYNYKLDNSYFRKITMQYLSFLSYNIYNLWIYPNSGIYFNDNNNDKHFMCYGLYIPTNLEIPTTSNSYTTYAQSNLNSLQTNINQAETARQIANQEVTVGLVTSAITTALGVALAPVTMGASLGLAVAGTAYMGVQTNKWINTQIKNNFEVDSLQNKINDMKNTPNTISSLNNDFYWLTYFNNNGYFDLDMNGDPINNFSVSKFLVSSISDIDKKILFDWYYYNGYLFNRYTNDLNFDEKRNRYILNFYKIKDIKTLLSSCPDICNEDIEWWNNTFQQGIIIWETEDPLHLYDEQIYIGNNKYENWETELLNNNYILQKIKEDKSKQEKIKQDQRAAKLLSNIVKEQKGGN